MTDGNRTQRLEALRRKTRTQVLVIGGGINGVSIYRELALNGVDVVLVERDDFMSGASSAPSRMIHGGLRYMENGDFALVRESLRERNLLLANASHLVAPLPTLIPITSHLSGIWSAARRFLGANVSPGDRGALIIKLGLSLYDLYAGRGGSMPRHRFFGARETRARWPQLRDNVVASAIYYDAKISHPERLGIELVLESEQTGNVLALNHVGLTSLSDMGAVLQDRLTGETFTLDADVIVNATGAWIDLTNDAMATRPPRLIGGTKGSHLVIDNAQLKQAIGGEMVYFANSEGRVCIVFEHLGNVLAGSTDINVQTPDGIRCEEEEVDYILTSLGEVFPNIPITPDEIIYRFAGVRPLPNSEGKVNANISRDHSCEWLEASGLTRPVLSLVGGKWTTFRAFGEEAADKVLARLGLTRQQSTLDRQIGGGRNLPQGQAREALLRSWAQRIDAEYGGQLLARYGSRAVELAGSLQGRAERLDALPRFSREEIIWLIETEHVATLADLVLRRMTIAFTGELSSAAIDELASIAASVLGWSDAERKSQIASLLERLEYFHGLPESRLRSRNPDRKDNNVRRQKSPDEPPVRKRQVS